MPVEAGFGDAASPSTAAARSPTSTPTAAPTSSSWSSAGSAELWHNETGGGNAWLDVRLTGTRSNRDGIGARVTVGEQVRTMTTAAGYASSSHAGVHFGLGNGRASDRAGRMAVGVKQVVEKVGPNRVVEIKSNSSLPS